MKYLLLIQSLSPIALLMLLKIFPFSDWNEPKFSFCSYCSNNFIFSVLLIIFAAWLLIALFSWLYLCSFNKIEYQLKNQTIDGLIEDKESSLNFFMTFLLPLVIDDVTQVNGFLVFVVSFIGVIYLLAKTTLFYKNPVLNLLGYRLFNIQLNESEVIGICAKYNESDKMKINYSEISKNVVFFKKI